MAYSRALYLTNPTMKGTDVKEVQSKLNYLGYYQGGIDSEFGLGCDKAVRQFQTNNGLTSDGSCGPATYNALFSYSAIPRTLYLTSPTMKGGDVSRVQERLKNLGYYTVAVDGEFGLNSKSATLEFQTTNGLVADGYFGPASHRKLMTDPKPKNNSGYTRALYLTNPPITGSDVGTVQTKLKSLNYYKGSIDNTFGKQSKLGILAFQYRNNLAVDGSCGPATWSKLISNSCNSNANSMNPRHGDVKYIYGIITTSTAKERMNYFKSKADGTTPGDIINGLATAAGVILGLIGLAVPFSLPVNFALWGGTTFLTIPGAKANYKELFDRYYNMVQSAGSNNYILVEVPMVYNDPLYANAPANVNIPYDSKNWRLSPGYITGRGYSMDIDNLKVSAAKNYGLTPFDTPDLFAI